MLQGDAPDRSLISPASVAPSSLNYNGSTNLHPNHHMISGRSIIAFFYAVVLVTTSLTYYYSIQEGRVTRTDFFISSSIDNQPGNAIGTFGLAVCAFLLHWIFIVRYQLVDNVLAKGHLPVQSYVLNKWGFRFGMLTSLGLVGVVSVPYHVNGLLHLTVALSFFSVAILWVSLQTYIDAKYISESRPDIVSKHMVYTRSCLSLVTIIGCIGMFAAIGNSSLVASVMELSMVTAFGLYFVTYWGDFARVKLSTQMVVDRNS